MCFEHMVPGIFQGFWVVETKKISENGHNSGMGDKYRLYGAFLQQNLWYICMAYVSYAWGPGFESQPYHLAVFYELGQTMCQSVTEAPWCPVVELQWLPATLNQSHCL